MKESVPYQFPCELFAARLDDEANEGKQRLESLRLFPFQQERGQSWN